MMIKNSIQRDGKKSGGRGHIGFVVDSLGGGGAERVIAILANEFSARNFDVDVIAIKASGEYRHSLSPRIRVIDFGVSLPGSGSSLKGLVVASIRLARYLRDEAPDVLMASLSSASESAIAAGRIVRQPVRIVIRPSSILETPRPSKVSLVRHIKRAMLGNNILARMLYRFSDAFVASSSGVLSSYEPILGTRPKRYLVRNPVVRAEIYDKSRLSCDHPWFAATEPPVVLAVGRLTQAKDLSTLIEAFSLVRRARKARLVILGRGECEQQLQDLVAHLGLSRDIDIAGYRDNPYAYMSRASVFVLSSIWEGLPNALIEALALGCRVVSTDCIGNGPREILDGGRYGWLVSPKDIAGMSAAIVEALDGSQKYSAQMLAEHLRQFEVNYVGDQYERVLFP